MTDLDQLLPLWQDLQAAEAEYVLATIVAVEGSGYRKPGARMLIAADGRRAGTISGGCLEAEVAKKAFWHTENGPAVRRYSTAAEDGDVPFGMGCGGVVHVLLERSATATPLMARLANHFAERLPIAITTILDGDQTGQRAFWDANEQAEPDWLALELQSLARQALEEQRSFPYEVTLPEGQIVRVRTEYCASRPGLFIFGAGDDAIPLVKMARQLGWYVAVADGRSHLATPARFPDAHETHVLLPGEFPALPLRPTDAAAVMTHSLEQDTRILSHLLPLELGYLGVLGPRRRTADLLLTVAGELEVPASEIEAAASQWLEELHAPMGLDLGGEAPRDIALAVMAEIQQSRNRGSGLPLRAVRARLSEQNALAATS